MNVCVRCGKTVTADEIGMTKKLINRGAEQYLCMTCLARSAGVSEQLLRNKLEEFRAAGCTLFPPHPN